MLMSIRNGETTVAGCLLGLSDYAGCICVDMDVTASNSYVLFHPMFFFYTPSGLKCVPYTDSIIARPLRLRDPGDSSIPPFMRYR